MRWINKQRGADCVPVAILNTMKWLGHKATSKDLPKLRKQCGTDQIGSRRHQFENVIFNLKGAKVKRIDSITLTQVKKALKDNCLIMMCSIIEDEEICHFYIIHKYMNHRFHFINLSSETEYNTPMHPLIFKMFYLRRFSAVWGKVRYKYPYAYIIKKV